MTPGRAMTPGCAVTPGRAVTARRAVNAGRRPARAIPLALGLMALSLASGLPRAEPAAGAPAASQAAPQALPQALPPAVSQAAPQAEPPRIAPPADPPRADPPAGPRTAEPVPAGGDAPPPRPPGAAQAVTQAIAAGGHDLSPWTMFLNADLLVKAVMSGLALASVLTWTILLAKSIELGLARRALVRALVRIAGAPTLAEAGAALKEGRSAGRGVADRLVAAVADEMRISDGAAEGVKERAASRCAELVKAEGRAARRGMGALATTGAISPFVGLFGTVWGIMNSFIGISKAQTTNLAVVAPGIAEALLATAIGLAAAIPAVIVYNHFARATRAYGDLVQRASGAAMRLLSRDLDRDAARRGPRPLPRAAE